MRGSLICLMSSLVFAFGANALELCGDLKQGELIVAHDGDQTMLFALGRDEASPHCIRNCPTSKHVPAIGAVADKKWCKACGEETEYISGWHCQDGYILSSSATACDPRPCPQNGFEALECGALYAPHEAQSHYLKNVMRLKEGDEVFLFDGKNGEFKSVVCANGKRNLHLEVKEKTADFCRSPDVWLLFAPLKKENTDLVIQKAVELGVRKIVPVMTEYAARINLKAERVQTQIIEAAEQSRRQDVPEAESLKSFDDVLKNWPKERKLIYL